ncbi:uncharacterized protein Z518_02227 [Rhinocladiella mackenziei CBS 650.93]|uniref:Kinetochore protein mis13 n=1 Tax=Rhinocladiella mackenziei CBS 650.93 TaxID=1442369 RepID=A0A0D2IP24_9EURO|nr:uncharacterized protein Z518_02227 [Rhinocladiella mackenziei CBS 650.93]KIX07574.1 hypothetical protein Z518_02227 [Rhinocladiella mackenziei CBS 650.93]
MSSTQRPNRRISARLQENEDAPALSTRTQVNGHVDASGRSLEAEHAQTSKGFNEKKRKMDYDEEDDGFLFKRVKKKKPKVNSTEDEDKAKQSLNHSKPPQKSLTHSTNASSEDGGPMAQTKKRRNRRSFSTPNPKEDAPVRRSKRLSGEHEQQDRSPIRKMPHKQEPKPQERHREEQARDLPKMTRRESPGKGPKDHGKETVPIQEGDRSATKIVLPFADTPVIKRNKAMREGKDGKGERRSSLGLRGRRASSLIESGNSNALPHHEVDIPDFYKHIESDGLPEPRRMRQLLTWCATRMFDEKPMGTDFEDSSARSAARVIEEELLKDLANKSELSDWFSQEDFPVPKNPLPERPNPKNVQNIEKIAELEEQIRQLRAEKEALESLLQPPNLPSLHELGVSNMSMETLQDRSLLCHEDILALDSTAASTTSSDQVSKRLNDIYQSLGPTIDTFADGVHAIGQYRSVADSVAGKVLAICADKLSQREKQGRKRALPVGQGSPPKDLGGVLRSLSRADR